MKIRGYAVTYAGESQECNQENYYLNGICKEDVEALGCCTVNKDTRSRNLYALSSAVNSEVAGMDLAYIAVDVLKGFFGADFTKDNGEYFNIANSAITSHVFESGNEHFDVESSVVYIEKDVASVYNIGNAPVFFYADGEIKKVSGAVPESVQVKKTSYNDYGILQVKDVEKETAKHLGVLDDNCEIVPFASEPISLKGDSYFVLCSKALAKAVDTAEIKRILQDKDIKEADKANAIMSRALEHNTEDNYTVVVIAAKKGIAVAQAELKSFYRWVAIAVVCVMFCAFGEGIAVGFGNMVKGIESFVDHYTMGEDEQKDYPLYVPKNKTNENTDVKEDAQEKLQEASTEEEASGEQPSANSGGNRTRGTSSGRNPVQRPQSSPAQAAGAAQGTTQPAPVQPAVQQPAPQPAPAQPAVQQPPAPVNPAPVNPAPAPPPVSSGGSLPIDD